MKRKFNLKILAGFVLLILILLVAGVISFLELAKLESSVESLIEDNYKTIEASKSMVEALEREDSGILMVLLGQGNAGAAIIHSADSSFIASLEVAKGNQTETDEDKFVDAVEENYNLYKTKWAGLFDHAEQGTGIDWYNNELHNDFLKLKRSVNNLMDLNQESMYGEANSLKDRSRRAIMPGILAIITSIIFCVLFNFFINIYFTSPLNRLIKAINQLQPKDRKLGITIRTNDELKNLEKEINNMVERFSKSEK